MDSFNAQKLLLSQKKQEYRCAASFKTSVLINQSHFKNKSVLTKKILEIFIDKLLQIVTSIEKEKAQKATEKVTL